MMHNIYNPSFSNHDNSRNYNNSKNDYNLNKDTSDLNESLSNINSMRPGCDKSYQINNQAFPSHGQQYSHNSNYGSPSMPNYTNSHQNNNISFNSYESNVEKKPNVYNMPYENQYKYSNRLSDTNLSYKPEFSNNIQNDNYPGFSKTHNTRIENQSTRSFKDSNNKELYPSNSVQNKANLIDGPPPSIKMDMYQPKSPKNISSFSSNDVLNHGSNNYNVPSTEQFHYTQVASHNSQISPNSVFSNTQSIYPTSNISNMHGNVTNNAPYNFINAHGTDPRLLNPQFSSPNSAFGQQNQNTSPPLATHYQQPNFVNQTAPQTPRRIDPDSLPDPISLMEEDNKLYKETIYDSSVLSKVPPKSTTDFVAICKNNCNPRFLRSTLYSVPISSEILKSTALTFGVIVQPFALVGYNEDPIHLVDHGKKGPIRCTRCKGYINPFVKFINGGKHFLCNLCGQSNDVPSEYFCHLNQNGHRLDMLNRPELVFGSHDFVATEEYCRQNIWPSKVTFFFSISVTYQSMSSGYTKLVCDELIKCIDSDVFPLFNDNNSNLQSVFISIVAYDRRMYFFNTKQNKPSFHVVSDLDEPFLPTVREFSVDLLSNKHSIIECLKAIPRLFASNCETEIILAPMVKSSIELAKALVSPVKLFLFHTGMPSYEAPGKLKIRDERKLLGTEKQKIALSPQNDYYSTLGKECVDSGLTIDLFIGNSSNYIDLSTVGLLATLTGGHIHRYSNINVFDGQIGEDIQMALTRKIAFDSFLRLRTSSGIRPSNFYGNFVMSNSTDIELASIDSEQSVAIEISYDDKISDSCSVYLQCALLYTSFSGRRLIRVHNLALATTCQGSDVLKHCDQDSLITFITKRALSLTMHKTPVEITDSITSQCVNVLANYKTAFVQTGTTDRLVLPETLKLLPLYCCSLIKSDMISGGFELSTDDRFFIYSMVMSMNVSNTLALIYPRLILLGKNISENNHSISANDPNLFDNYTSDNNWRGCKIIRCSFDRIPPNGICFLDNGISLYLYMNHECSKEDKLLSNILSPDQISQVFRPNNNQSQQSLTAIGGGSNSDCELIGDLPIIDSMVSKYLRSLIQNLRLKRGRCTKLYIVRNSDRLDLWFKHYLAEDKSINNFSNNYGDYLCLIFREIKNVTT